MKLWTTSGIVPERRPPKMNALIGTPFGSSQSGSSDRVLRRRRGEAGVGVRRLGARLGRPVVALPVDRVRRRVAVHALPPHVAVVGERDVGEDRVGPDRLHRVRVGRVRRARRDAEVAGLGVDRVELAVGARLDPGDVVADGRDLPAFVGERRRRDEHREVGLAARARERGGDVRLLALGSVTPMISMCSASQPSSRAIVEAMRRRGTSCRAARCRRSRCRSSRSSAPRGSARCT